MTDTPRDRLIQQLEQFAEIWEQRGSVDIGAATERLTCELLREAAALLRAEAEPNLTAHLLASQGQVAALRAVEKAARAALAAFDDPDDVVSAATVHEMFENLRAALASLDSEPAGRSQE